MKTYRVMLVILLVVVLGCGAWYFFVTMKSDSPLREGTLVKKCENLCGCEKL